MRPFAQAVASEMANPYTGSVTNVYIDGARINDDPQIRNATKAYLVELMRTAAI